MKYPWSLPYFDRSLAGLTLEFKAILHCLHESDGPHGIVHDARPARRSRRAHYSLIKFRKRCAIQQASRLFGYDWITHRGFVQLLVPDLLVGRDRRLTV